LTGCTGVQSALSPAGDEATRISALFWWMAGGALVIWAAVVLLALYYGRRRPAGPSQRRDRLLIVGGGVAVPVVVLSVLLLYGLSMIPPLVARAPEGSLQVDVLGEQWWWRVRYQHPSGSRVELANEIRLPVGEPVQFRLESHNVIHSFWVPSLGGKMDMIPGRTTFLTLRPTRTGVYRGVCAEYCGASHALMAFYVEVMEKEAFARWLDGQAAPARPPETVRAARGSELFLSNGCGACHYVAGTPATGRLGPDLTHVASRHSLAAGIMPNSPGTFLRWVAEPEHFKPGAHMPRFGMLSQDDLDALAAYLAELR
jgi:cytochrome c oxidase subunit 2